MAKKDLIDVVVIDKFEPMDYSLTIGNEREKTKIIKRIERHIRSSLEYRDYIAFLRENVGMDACAFFNNINKDTSRSLRIEIHHTPFTLYDYVKIVVQKYMAEGIPLNDLYIAEEVMNLHYKNQVGLIPLSKTLHLIVHGDNADKLVIPAYMIFGDYKQFIEEYQDYMDDYDFTKVEEMIKKTKELKEDSYEILEKKYDYLKVDGFEIPQKIEKEGEVKKEEQVAC